LPRKLRDTLINPNFARLWYGQAVSTVGDYVFDTTLVLWVATVLGRGKPWAPAAVSGVLLSASAAVFLIGPLAGVFVDRWNRRLTMMHTELIRAAIVGLLTCLAFLPVRDLPVPAWLAVLYVLVFALNAAGQFFSPARLAVLGDVVPGEVDRARASGIQQATAATASIIGPPLAAPLLFTVGFQWALLLNAASYVVSFFAVRSVQLDRAAGQPAAAATGAASFRREFTSGLRYFVSSRYLVVLLVIVLICACGTGAVNALDIFFVTRNLHTSSHLYGYLGMALGVGAIAGALCAGRVVRWLTARTTTWLTLVAGGLGILIYARQTAFVSGVVVLFLTAVPIAIVNTAITPLLLAAAPRELLGRVVAVINPVQQLASMLSVVAAGWLASTALRNFSASVAGVHIGPIDTIFTASGLLIVIGGGYGLFALPGKSGTAAPAAGAQAERSGSASTA
jgi:MFS family permease